MRRGRGGFSFVSCQGLSEALNMDKLLDWWQRGLIAALGLSIVLLGVGGVEFFAFSGGMSAWSVSRTTFFFWLLWKLLLLYHRGWAEFELNRLKVLAPLYLFLSRSLYRCCRIFTRRAIIVTFFLAVLTQ
jgi:hypothetical protein